jgi:cbb3-type cytochrome oxidase maturation protein
MNVLAYMLPIALFIGIGALFTFLWTLKNGQYDDIEGAAHRILSDDDLPKKTTKGRES